MYENIAHDINIVYSFVSMASHNGFGGIKMPQDYFTNRWIIGGFCFLIVFGIACYVWYQHELAPYEQQAADNAELRHQAEPAQKVEAGRNAKPTTDALVESAAPPAEKRRMETTDEAGKADAAPSKIHPNLMEQTQETEKTEVRVSPYGFGPYPKLPTGWKDAWHTLTAEDELAIRVWIKLLEQGYDVEGIGYIPPDRLLVPTIKGTMYIRTDSEGYITFTSGHPDDGQTLEAIRQQKFQVALEPGFVVPDDFEPLRIKVEDIPGHIKVIDANNAIEPYQFLGLNKE